MDFGEFEHQKSIRKQLAVVLRDAIFSGKIKPGERIVESQLAKDMRVGQPSVREALQDLEHEGLVTRISKRGCRVTDLSNEDVAKIFDVRTELETLAIAKMPPAVVPELCQRLEVTLAEMEAADKNHDIPRYSMVDYEFHRTIWKFSGNEFLVRALEGVTMPLWAFSIIYFCRYRAKEDVDPMDLGLHRQMLNIIKSEAPIEEKQAGIRKILQTFQQKEQHDLSSRRNENSEKTAPDEPASANSFQALAQNDHVR